MKTREEVEKLKLNWKSDPMWDIETTEGFEDYKDELKAYHEQCVKEWDDRAKKHHDMLESFFCPIITAGFSADPNITDPDTKCRVEKCAWWNSIYEKCSIAVEPYLKGLQEQREEARAEAEYRRKHYD